MQHIFIQVSTGVQGKTYLSIVFVILGVMIVYDLFGIDEANVEYFTYICFAFRGCNLRYLLTSLCALVVPRTRTGQRLFSYGHLHLLYRSG